jgi:hypothetical protein
VSRKCCNCRLKFKPQLRYQAQTHNCINSPPPAFVAHSGPKAPIVPRSSGTSCPTSELGGSFVVRHHTGWAAAAPQVPPSLASSAWPFHSTYNLAIQLPILHLPPDATLRLASRSQEAFAPKTEVISTAFFCAQREEATSTSTRRPFVNQALESRSGRATAGPFLGHSDRGPILAFSRPYSDLRRQTTTSLPLRLASPR